MRIASIALKDFRCYEQAEVTFSEPLSIFRGINGDGKTSLRQAIQLSLTIQTDGTDPRGAGANKKIRLGASKALIDTAVETKQGGVLLKTTYGPNKTGRQQEVIGSSNGVGPGFDGWMKKNADRLPCVLDCRYFTGLTPKDQKNVLAALVLPTNYDFDPAMVELAEGRLGKFKWDNPPVSVIDQVYSVAYDTRKTSKATLGAIHIPQQPQKPEYDAERVQKELAAARLTAAKEAKKVTRTGTAQTGRLEQEIEQKNRELAQALTDKAEASNKREEADRALLDGPALTKIKKVAAGRKLFEDLQAKITEANRDRTAQIEAQQIYEEMRINPECPTCTQPITDTFIDGKIGEHKRLEVEAADQIHGMQLEQKSLGDINGAEKTLQAQEQHTQAKLEQVRIFTAKSELVQKLTQEIDKLTVELGKARAADSQPQDTSALDAANAEVSAWESRLSPAVQYESTLEAIKRESGRYDAQKQEVADLETLCAYFGPNGIKAQLIAKHLDEFAGNVNLILGTWGFGATFCFEPWEFLVSGKKGQLPIEELCGGESFIFGVALQCAIAVHSKIRMVVIDEADTLVDADRNRLFSCVNKLITDGKLEQAIILEATASTEVKQKPGVAYYRVAGGKVERL